MQGFEDPFNRGTFPWGAENRRLVDYFRRLGALRTVRKSLRRGDLTYLCADGPVLAFRRVCEGETSVAACNAGEESIALKLPWSGGARDALTGRRIPVRDGIAALTLAPREGALLIET